MVVAEEELGKMVSTTAVSNSPAQRARFGQRSGATVSSNNEVGLYKRNFYTKS